MDVNTSTLTIAICTFNRADYLRDTLRDLSIQEADPTRFEILVINNNSTDHTAEICDEFAENNRDLQFKAVNESNQGLSHARNRAVKEAAGQYLLFIDDDVALEIDFIEIALEQIDDHPDIKCAGGRIFVRFDGADSQPRWIPRELMPMFGLHDLGNRSIPYPSNNFPRGGNMMIHRSVFENVGMFDTDLGRIGKELYGSEEKAFFDRARRAGYKLWYLPDISLFHRIGPNRLEPEYLKEQSIGIGKSEYLRLKSSRMKLAAKFISEIWKLGGSLLLAVGYRLQRRKRAARFLIQFRLWVLKGFLSSKK